MEGKTGNHDPKVKKVPKKFQERFDKESRKNSPEPSTSREPAVPNQQISSEMPMADPVSNSYLFSKDKPPLSLIASPLDSNSSFLYHYFNEDNNDVSVHDNPEPQALGKLIKNYLGDDNEEAVLQSPSQNVLHQSSPSWTGQIPKLSIQKQLSSRNSNLPLNTRILSPLQAERTENEVLPKLMSPPLKPEIYTLDPFGNDLTEREQLRQSIKAASQKYENALKTLENVIHRLSEPWPGRKKRLKENNVMWLLVLIDYFYFVITDLFLIWHSRRCTSCY